MGIHSSFRSCLYRRMFQPDLFGDTLATTRDQPGSRTRQDVVPDRGPARAIASKAADTDEELGLPAVLERLARVSRRPRYTFMVLNLIARAAGRSDSAGPYVEEQGRFVPVRDWLSQALLPMAQRDARRLAIVDQVRRDLERQGQLPPSPDAAERIVAEEVRTRLLHSGRTNVSRAVSDLVRAGLLRRHYQGYRVDHCNRGAQREAVYTIVPAVRRAMGKTA